MELFIQILVAMLLGFLIYRLFTSAKAQPEMFSKKNMGKSFTTMGLLALGLMAFVGFLIILVNN